MSRNLDAERPLGDKKKISKEGGGREQLSYEVSLVPTNQVDIQVQNSKHMDKNRDAQSN